jgi:CBS domain-containing protein
MGEQDDVAYDEALGLRVLDVMRLQPRSVPADVTVGEVRATFQSPRVRVVLFTDGAVLFGAARRADIPETARDDEPARNFVRTDVPWVSPETPVADVAELIAADPDRRLIVLDEQRVLRGLLCLNGSGTAFCR